jgi:hypothetical protein
MGIRYEIEEENATNNTNTNTTSNDNNNNNNNVGSGSKNNTGLRVRAQQLHEDEEDMEEDDEDEEYGEDFNDNFVVDYENVDRRTLIKELVNASNALGSANDQISSSNNDASKKSSSLSAPGNANLSNDSDLAGWFKFSSFTSCITCFHFFDLFCYCVSFIASNLNDSGRDAIYKDLMSTISAAAAAISGRLQNQLSTKIQHPLTVHQYQPPMLHLVQMLLPQASINQQPLRIQLKAVQSQQQANFTSKLHRPLRSCHRSVLTVLASLYFIHRLRAQTT